MNPCLDLKIESVTWLQYDTGMISSINLKIFKDVSMALGSEGWNFRQYLTRASGVKNRII